MENNYSNYDMFDKLIANNKKAQSWTIFWVTALCLLAAAVLWMAYAISEKNKTISNQRLALQTQAEFLEVKNHLIDSLTANCNAAKTAIVNKCDSAISKTQAAIQEVIAMNVNNPNPVDTGEGFNQKNIKLKEADESIISIKKHLYNVKMEAITEKNRIFIQYNDKDNSGRVEALSGILKDKANYYIAPAEYVDNSFATVIRFLNFENADDEKLLKDLIAREFNINPGNIAVKHETNANVKSIVEIWIGTRPLAEKQQMMIKN